MENNQISKLELIQAQVSFIPDGWKLDKVGKTLVIKNTFRKPISQEVRSKIPGCYPYHGPTKIQDYISDYEQDGVYALIGEDGDHFLKYSTMRQTQFISGKCTVNNHAHIIESSDECDSEWFYIFFKHRNITNFLSRQGAGRFKLNKATLEKLPLLVPPLPEQRKIAIILGSWDKAISTTERLIDNSKQQKKALMQQLLTGKKRFKKTNGVNDYKKNRYGEIPRDWDYPQIKYICIPLTEKNTQKKDYPVLSCSKHIGFVDSLKYFKKKVFSDDTSGYRIIPKGCFGFPSNHIEEGSIGLQNIYEMGIVSPIYVIFKADQERVNNTYLFYLLKTEHYRQIFSAATNASVDRRGSLRWKEFQIIHIPLPSLEEQQKIADVIVNADKEIKTLEQQLADLKQEKKALMQQLLTGKRRVTV